MEFLRGAPNDTEAFRQGSMLRLHYVSKPMMWVAKAGVYETLPEGGMGRGEGAPVKKANYLETKWCIYELLWELQSFGLTFNMLFSRRQLRLSTRRGKWMKTDYWRSSIDGCYKVSKLTDEPIDSHKYRVLLNIN